MISVLYLYFYIYITVKFLKTGMLKMFNSFKIAK